MFTARCGLNVYIQFTSKLVIAGLINGDLFRRQKRDSSFLRDLNREFSRCIGFFSCLKKRKYFLTSYRGNTMITDSERVQKMNGNTFQIQLQSWTEI